MKEVVKREVWHTYSQDELDAVREEFANSQIKLEELKEKKSEVAKEYNEKIKSAESSQRATRWNIKNGGENKFVDCEEIPNYATGQIEYFSVATGEVVDSRRMTPAERQVRLDVVAIKQNDAI